MEHLLSRDKNTRRKTARQKFIYIIEKFVTVVKSEDGKSNKK